MARKRSREELERALARAEERELVATWMLRQARAYPKDSYVVLERPRSGPLVVRTDEHGCPIYTIEPLDSGRCKEEFIMCHAEHERYDAFGHVLARAKSILAGNSHRPDGTLEMHVVDVLTEPA